MKSFSEIKSLSKNQFKSNWKLPVLFTVITLVLSGIANATENGSFIAGLLLVVVSIYSTNLYLNIAKFNEVKDINIPGNKLLRAFGVSFLNTILIFGVTTVLLFVSAIIAKDNIVLILICSVLIYAAIFFIGVYLSFSLYLILDMDYKIFNSMKYSFLYMKGNLLKTLWLYITFIPWILLGFITLGLGFLYIGPYLQTVYANYYLEIRDQFHLR
ncbi:DUF975 family protein [Romboutsia lituseburensis]|uniref:Uncharacterized membrane protein n=1 Tax=Romboutsia lituseburensis DSM 797 TaxID=1121325 RepID=A0A1G9JDG9_9FIRM|nr:DUF975 family protein [Romboutsia lituseburensis]CEH33530.1 Protein of unknown function (DUF975) [Romboutsia lituseburensis]SDL35629.1 Uncharacterized membrane protein [Romboutsia lituseburensis DSM 797]